MDGNTIILALIGFNSRSREGSDYFNQNQLWQEIVSIHAPARGATYSPNDTRGTIAKFQFTLPRGERLCRWGSSPLTIRFNSRSREGSDWDYPIRSATFDVSIHAPARGATPGSTPLPRP